MMALSREVSAIQNPALGAVLVWQYCAGYTRRAAVPAPLETVFLVLPLSLNPFSRSIILSTFDQSGFRAVVSKLGRPPGNIRHLEVAGIQVRRGREQLLAVNHRMLAFRQLSLDSLNIAIGTGLLSLDVALGGVSILRPIDDSMPVPPTVRDLVKASSRLGNMLGAFSLQEIADLLKVSF